MQIERGELNMSIGTSMAFENVTTDILFRTDILIINLRTIIRNVIDAFDSIESVSKDTIAKIAKEDLIEIAKLIEARRGAKSIGLKIYYPSYSSIKQKFKNALIKEPKTDKQKELDKLVEASIKIITKENPKLISQEDCSLPEFQGRALLLSNYLTELALSNSLTRIQLLESYTGNIKQYYELYTKLTGCKELTCIPFNKLTLQIFGDKSLQFFSQKKSVKDYIINLAKLRGWTNYTSFSKVRNDINGMVDSFDKRILLSMIKI